MPKPHGPRKADLARSAARHSSIPLGFHYSDGNGTGTLGPLSPHELHPLACFEGSIVNRIADVAEEIDASIFNDIAIAL